MSLWIWFQFTTPFLCLPSANLVRFGSLQVVHTLSRIFDKSLTASQSLAVVDAEESNHIVNFPEVLDYKVSMNGQGLLHGRLSRFVTLITKLLESMELTK